MANEYLKRTPTSTGNRKVFTWSGWVKKTENSGGFGRLFESGAIGNRTYFTYTDLDEIRFSEQASNSNRDSLVSNYKLRDSSSICHVMIAVNSTLSHEDDRVKIYINGSLINNHGFSTDDPPALNALFQHNELGEVQYIGNSANQAADFQGYMSDVFHIDGQALTPDVFGFYKDGDGYMSSGTTQATDFRPGQWMPHSPAKIKKDVNRRGGFGVNGFYLPMNDSSNPGADFHCAPNSIIKLKGEDLPQPRNGAPTTTDAYVSQLRSDPFAANLVLAVPGASTATGANLVTNGTFDTNTTGWTLNSANGTLVASGGELEIQRVSTNGTHCYQQITTESGKRYTVSFDARSTDAAQPAKFQAGTSINGTELMSRIDTNSATMTHQTASFTATGTTTYITLGSNYTANSFWNNIVVKQEDAARDYSADIKGSGTNKILTPYDTAGVGYELGGYYGSAMQFEGTGDDDYVDTGYSIDGTFGSGDYTIECWIHTLDDQGERGIFGMFGSQYGISMRQFGSYNAGGNQTLQAFFGQSAAEYRCGTTVRIQDQWNHVAMVKDGTIGTLYLNGVAVGIADNVSSTPYSTSNLLIGIYYNGSYPYKGYIQDFRVYTTAKYKGGFDVPKPYTPVGIEAFRTTADTCKNNFPTLNPLFPFHTDGVSYSDGNLFAQSSINNKVVQANMAFTSGKWYWETRNYNDEMIGIGVAGGGIGHYPGTNTNALSYHFGGDVYDSGTSTNYGAGWAGQTYHVIGIAVDKDNDKVYWHIDGVWANSANPVSGTGGWDILSTNEIKNAGTHVAPSWRVRASGASEQVSANFGQNPSFSGTVTAGTNADDSGKGLFKYAPPTGFLALCEDNLPTPTIADPGKHFKTVLYTGSGSSKAITGVGFQPDFVWLKSRTNPSTGIYNTLVDSVRGAPLALFSNSTDTEDSPGGVSSPASVHGGISSFDNNGFSIMSGSTDTFLNNNGTPYVAWCWKAGGAAVSNTDGTITSQVSVNQDAGFSIVSYTGNETDNATVGHGLGKVPDMIIVKNRNSGVSWGVWHSSLASGQVLRLDQTTEAQTPGTAYFQDELNTSSLFGLGTNDETNDNDGDTYIAYCWAEIEGFSKFGSYVGNNSADGPFVYCGFKPAWVMIKATSGTRNWRVNDSSRSSSNPVNKELYPNLSNAEGTFVNQDFLSNGFKLRNNNTQYNSDGVTYIFAAFAESPFQTANAK